MALRRLSTPRLPLSRRTTTNRCRIHLSPVADTLRWTVVMGTRRDMTGSVLPRVGYVLPPSFVLTLGEQDDREFWNLC